MGNPIASIVHHQASYNATTGSYRRKQDATNTAEYIRQILSEVFVDFLPNAVQVEGKKDMFWIAFPRIARHWHPKARDGATLRTELATIAAEFQHAFNLKETSDDE